MQSPNIALICLDTVRKDRYDTHASQLRGMASYKHNQMRALSTWSVPSHGSLITGQLPSEHGVHGGSPDYRNIDTTDVWINDLPEQYTTHCASSNIYAGPTYYFDRFFDSHTIVSNTKRFNAGSDVQKFLVENDARGISKYRAFFQFARGSDSFLKTLGNGVISKAAAITNTLPVRAPLDEGARSISRSVQAAVTDDSPSFVFANYMDAHGPYKLFRSLNADDVDADEVISFDWEITREIHNADNPKQAYEKYEDRLSTKKEIYNADIRYLDSVISSTLDTIESKTSRPTIVIITADHGENFGTASDERLLHHTTSLSEALLHVPFDIIGLNCDIDKQQVSSLGSHADIGSVIRSLVSDGEIPDISRETTAAEIIGAAYDPEENAEYWDRAQRAVYNWNSKQKIVRDGFGNKSVYEVDTDRPSVQTQINEQPADETDFDTYFEEWIHTQTTRMPPDDKTDISNATRNQLEELGYM